MQTGWCRGGPREEGCHLLQGRGRVLQKADLRLAEVV